MKEGKRRRGKGGEERLKGTQSLRVSFFFIGVRSVQREVGGKEEKKKEKMVKIPPVLYLSLFAPENDGRGGGEKKREG